MNIKLSDIRILCPHCLPYPVAEYFNQLILFHEQNEPLPELREGFPLRPERMLL